MSIAYQIVGDGPFDVVRIPPFVSHVELAWQVAGIASFTRRLASFCRLILFDKRGTGMSDRVSGAPTLEVRMDDVRAVMDAVGSERAALLGVSEGGAMSILFAATYPERVWALVLEGASARGPSGLRTTRGVSPRRSTGGKSSRTSARGAPSSTQLLSRRRLLRAPERKTNERSPR